VLGSVMVVALLANTTASTHYLDIYCLNPRASDAAIVSPLFLVIPGHSGLAVTCLTAV